MTSYFQGQPVTVGPITVKQRNTDGTYSLVDAGTVTTTVKLAAADGTLTTTGTYSSPAHDSLGTYHQDVPVADLTANGHYQYAVVTTGTGAGVQTGEFDVIDPFTTSVLALQDAKDQLNIPQSSTASDSEIASWIATIESNLERATGGPLVNRVVTERSEMMAGQTVIPVRQRPLVSVVSIASATGGAVDLSAGLDLDVNAGLIRRKLGLPFIGPFYGFLPQVTVTYVAGWGTSVPAAFNSFARVVVAHLWTSQRGQVTVPMGGADLVQIPGFGFMVPNLAAEMLNGSQGGVPFLSEAYA